MENMNSPRRSDRPVEEDRGQHQQCQVSHDSTSIVEEESSQSWEQRQRKWKGMPVRPLMACIETQGCRSGKQEIVC